MLPVRGTRPSTPRARSLIPLKPPSDGVRSRWSGCRVQGTANSPPSATGQKEPSSAAILSSPGRIAQRESARFTRERSLVQSQVRPSSAFSGRLLSRQLGPLLSRPRMPPSPAPGLTGRSGRRTPRSCECPSGRASAARHRDLRHRDAARSRTYAGRGACSSPARRPGPDESGPLQVLVPPAVNRLARHRLLRIRLIDAPPLPPLRVEQIVVRFGSASPGRAFPAPSNVNSGSSVTAGIASAARTILPRNGSTRSFCPFPNTVSRRRERSKSRIRIAPQLRLPKSEIEKDDQREHVPVGPRRRRAVACLSPAATGRARVSAPSGCEDARRESARRGPHPRPTSRTRGSRSLPSSGFAARARPRSRSRCAGLRW